ncbi:MAG: AAA family ATPase [Desulforhabdus sp.]|nr:AAA family ATPase [Desulforhabdus sp.]
MPAEKWEFIRQVSRAFFEHRQQLFKRRVETNRIKDGHGDLRAEHIYFYDGIQIIDCIEFNDRFRYGDVIADLAFLHMDLEHLGRPDLSRIILAAYVEQADDPELYSLIDFYAAYRAVVKLKVACLRSAEAREQDKEALRVEAQGFLQQAYRYALQFSRPTLWLFCGLPATGKSALSRQIGEDLSLEVLQTDEIRMQGEGCPMSAGVVPYGEGPYRLELRHRVYAQMFARAQELLKGGQSVALDASFSRAKWRQDARQLAADLDTNFIVVECTCREETMRKRLLQREDESGFSHARVHHLVQMKKAFEPVVELTPDMHLRVDTDRPFLHVLDEILKEGYARKCEQIKAIL